MSVFMESPWPAVTAAIGIEIVLAVVLYVTGRGGILGAMAGVAVLAAVMVGVERWAVTDRELVSDALDGIAAAVASNDAPKVLTFISPQAVQIRQEIPGRMNTVVIRAAKVNDLKIDLQPPAAPTKATARFIGRIEGQLKRNSLPHEVFIERFEVYFEKQQERWLVIGYKERRR